MLTLVRKSDESFDAILKNMHEFHLEKTTYKSKNNNKSQ